MKAQYLYLASYPDSSIAAWITFINDKTGGVHNARITLKVYGSLKRELDKAGHTATIEVEPYGPGAGNVVFVVYDIR